MAPTSAAEKTGTSGQFYSVPPPPPRRMMSPMGYLGVTLAMIVTVVIVFRAASSFQGGGTTTVQDKFETVELGQFTRELAPESGGFVRDPFMLKVVVVLNPKAQDRAALKAQVERRRDLFRDIVWDHILGAKSDADLRKPAVIETLKGEIRQRLNQELGGAKDGEEMISRVIFPERRLPERR